MNVHGMDDYVQQMDAYTILPPRATARLGSSSSFPPIVSRVESSPVEL